MTEKKDNKENKNIRIIQTPEYNTRIDMISGEFLRFGKSFEEKDDPKYSPIGPEIIDMEISTICNGLDGVPCKHCYKGNTGRGENMSYSTFTRIFNKLPKNVYSIAFGIGDIDSNPDIWKILFHTRAMGVVPNLTINGFGMTDDYLKILRSLCGAVSVSRYENKEYCYGTIKRLADSGLKQANIHLLVSEETEERCYETINDAVNDERLEKLNAIVLLSLKPKGKGKHMKSLPMDRFSKLIQYLMEKSENGKKFKAGFDSCSAPKFLSAVSDSEFLDSFKTQAEPCESTLFSLYINVNGFVYPCSFIEDEGEWKDIKINVLDCNDFLNDVWYHEKIKEFRMKLVNQGGECRHCPFFNIY